MPPKDKLHLLITEVQQYLADNNHPHTRIILDSLGYEILEGTRACEVNTDVILPD